MKIALLTPVHNRRKTFPFIEHYITRAIKGCPADWEITWIVVDDGTEPITPTCNQVYIRLEPFPDHQYTPAKSFVYNVRTGLEYIKEYKFDYVHFIEDDDWRSAESLFFYQSLFNSQQYHAVGEGNAIYYHIPTRKYRLHNNSQHASLCQTAISKKGLEIMLDVIYNLEQPTYLLDLFFWQKLNYRNRNLSMTTSHVIGLKGLTPGNGIGAGHCPDWYRQTDNEKREQLQSWIGKDVQLYC